MRVKPDFGYNTQAIVEDEEAETGWLLLVEYMNSFEKFERLDNFIAMRQQEQL